MFIIENKPTLLVGVIPIIDDDCLIEHDCCWPEPGKPIEPLAGVLYERVSDILVGPLPHGFRWVWSPWNPVGLSVLNAKAWAYWTSRTSSAPLRTDFDRELASAGLLQPVHERDREYPPFPVSHTFTVWLHVTNACNLNCPYCYVRKSSEALDVERGKQSLEVLINQAKDRGFTHLHIKYGGGEPTLHFRRVQQIHQWLQKRTREHGLELSATLLTNGTLLKPEYILWLKEQDIRLMISVDGVGRTHDALRHTKDGEGTFAKIAHLIDKELLPRDIKPSISMTVTSVNAQTIPDVIRWTILERSLPLSLNISRLPVWKQATDVAYEEAAIIRGFEEGYRLLEEHLPTWPFTAGLLDRVHLSPHRHTCGAGDNYLAVDHRGDIVSCHMLVGGGSVNAGVFPISVSNLDVAQKECATCPYRFLCTGGCPLETFQRTGRWEARNPNCRIYQTLIPQWLRLEGLRLMKAANYLA